MDFDNKNIVNALINGCKKGDRKAQKKLYMLLYPYTMSICLRYSGGEDEAKEILNDGFLKVFTKIDQHSPTQSFKAWVRRIMVNTAIDHYRKNNHFRHMLEITQADSEFINPEVVDQFSVDEILKMVQKLPPAYQMIFNLFVVEGYNHREISEKLGISEGTSKSNLAKARMKLKKMMEVNNTGGLSIYGS